MLGPILGPVIYGNPVEEALTPYALTPVQATRRRSDQKEDSASMVPPPMTFFPES